MMGAWPPSGVPGSEPTMVSLCPVWGWRCVEYLPGGQVHLDGAGFQSHWTVGSRWMDHPVVCAGLMFAPPAKLVRASARAGLQGGWRRNVPGLKEALERSGMKVASDA